MSVSSETSSADLSSIIKPYSGAGGTRLQRYAPWVVAIVAAVFCLPYGFYYALTTPWLLVPFLVPLALLTLLVIWVAPATKTVPVQLLERLFFALFVGFVLWPNYLAISLPGLPWITVSRLIGTPLALLFLVSLSTNAQFRTSIGKIANTTPIFWKAFLVVTALQIISLPLSNSLGASISRLVVLQTTQTIPLFLGMYLFQRPGRARYAAYAMWLMAICVSVIGLMEAPLRHTLWAGHIPSFLKIGDEAVARIIAGGVRNTTGQYRVQAVFSTALGLAEYLGLATPFVLHIALSRTTGRATRWIAAGTMPLILLLLLGTDSRFGLMVYFLSAMLYLLFWALLERRRHHSLLGMAIVMSYPVLFGLGVIASFAVGRIRSKVWGTGQYNDSTAARVEQLNLALPKVVTHPVGHGVGMGADAVGYRTPSGLLSIDSYFISLTMEIGIIGFAAFLIMFLSIAAKAFLAVIRTDDETSELTLLLPLAISLTVFIIIKSIFAQEDNHPFVYVLAGMTVALLYRYQSVQQAGASVSRRSSSGASGSNDPDRRSPQRPGRLPLHPKSMPWNGKPNDRRSSDA